MKKKILLECKIECMRSSGKGGQHVNTTDSAVRLTHLPTGISVKVQQTRSQHENKSIALEILIKKLEKLNEQKKKRLKTKKTKSVKDKEMQKKKHHSELKKNRKKENYDE